MNKVECPCCGAKLKITVEPFSALSDLGAPSRPAKSEYAAVRDVPSKPQVAFPTAAPKPKKFPLHTDTGKFRQALADVGFVEQAENGIFFNDKNVDSRRLKLWFGTVVATAERKQVLALEAALQKYFGDRLIMCGVYANAWDQRRGNKSYIVRLAL